MPPLPEFVKRYIHLNFNASLPTAAVKNRGMLTILRGAAGTRDKPQVARKNAADAYEWVELANTTDVAAAYLPLAGGTLTGTLTLGSGSKLATAGSAPSGNPGAACGASAPGHTVTGTDTAMLIDATTGTGCTTGVFTSITFSTARGSSNYAVVCSAHDNDAGLLRINTENRLSTGFDIRTADTPGDSTNYRFMCLVVDHDG